MEITCVGYETMLPGADNCGSLLRVQRDAALRRVLANIRGEAGTQADHQASLEGPHRCRWQVHFNLQRKIVFIRLARMSVYVCLWHPGSRTDEPILILFYFI